jgi:alkyl hydroperoxide reductase subunit AhpC
VYNSSALVPDFVASTTRGPIAFHEWAGISWVVLFAQERNTAIWTSELAQVEGLRSEWARADARVIGLLADRSTRHIPPARDGSQGSADVFSFPVIVDPKRQVLSRLATTRRNVAPARPVFIIDPYKNIRLTLSYARQSERNFREILGIVDGLRAGKQLGRREGESTAVRHCTSGASPARQHTGTTHLRPDHHSIPWYLGRMGPKLQR